MFIPVVYVIIVLYAVFAQNYIKFSIKMAYAHAPAINII